MSEDQTKRLLKSGMARYCLLALGVLCTVLGAVGAFLPILPTTPFLLLAAACFVRSSPAFHRRLLANRVFGPSIAQWQHDRTVPPGAVVGPRAMTTQTTPTVTMIVIATVVWRDVNPSSRCRLMGTTLYGKTEARGLSSAHRYCTTTIAGDVTRLR